MRLVSGNWDDIVAMCHQPHNRQLSRLASFSGSQAFNLLD